MAGLLRRDLRTFAAGTPSNCEDCEPLVGGFTGVSVGAPAPSRPWTYAAAALLAGPLLLGGAVTVARHLHLGRPLRVAAVEMWRKDVEVAGGLLPCAEPGQDCTAARCCSISGFRCYEKNATFAGCLPSCPPASNAWSCARPPRLRKTKPSVGNPGTRLFCFVVIALAKGVEQKNWELSLVRTQLRLGTSIFGCEDWMVFSDVSTWLSPGPPVRLSTVKVPAPHTVRRPSDGEWLNTPTFQNVWVKIRESGRWARNDWSVKADPDTVFLPSRLRATLARRQVTADGIYLTNCRGVTYGFFGALEVMSRSAFKSLLEHVEDCSTALAWNQTGAEWSEDLFAQRCMDLHGVDNVEDFSLLKDGACDAAQRRRGSSLPPPKPPCNVQVPGLHAFSTPEEYFACLSITQQEYPEPGTPSVKAPASEPEDEARWLRSAGRAARRIVEEVNSEGFRIAPRSFVVRMEKSDGVAVRLSSANEACNASVVANATSQQLGADTLRIDRLDPHELKCHGPSACEFVFDLQASTRTLFGEGSGRAAATCDTGSSTLLKEATLSIRKSLGTLSISTTDLKASADLQSGRLLEFIISSLEFHVAGGQPEECRASPLQEACDRFSLLFREKVLRLAEDPVFKESVASALRAGLNLPLPLSIRDVG